MKKILLLAALAALLFSCASPVEQFSNETEENEKVPLTNAAADTDYQVLQDMGSYYLLGGDIRLNKDDENHQPIIKALSPAQTAGDSANIQKAMKLTSVATWPNGRIPYYFKDTTAAKEKVIREAMDYLQSICNVTFIKSSSVPRDYKLEVSGSSGYQGTLGYTKKAQICISNASFGEVVHQLMHILGFSHEHQRHDRGNYITIDSVMNADLTYRYIPKELNGVLYSKVFGEYDYYSIMHDASRKVLYLNPVMYKDSIITTDPQMQDVIGQRRGLSIRDRNAVCGHYGRSTTHRINYKVGEFDNKRGADILKFENGKGWRVYSGGNNYYDSGEVWYSRSPGTKWDICNYVGDFDGDGKDDFMMFEYMMGLQVYRSTGTEFTTSKWIELGPGTFDDIVGDFDGDGKDDFVRYVNNRGWRVYLSTGSSFTDSGIWSSVLFQSSYDEGKYKGDFNGDGKDDLLLYNRNTGWRVLKSTGSGFTDSIWNTATTGTRNVTGDNVGDFNGDGKDDFIFYAYMEGTKLLLSTGSSFTGSWVDTGALETKQVGDFNGDGLDDLVWCASNGYYVYLSTGTDFTRSKWHEGYNIDTFLIADFHGDGRDDILQYFDQSWWKVLESAYWKDSFQIWSYDKRVPENR